MAEQLPHAPCPEPNDPSEHVRNREGNWPAPNNCTTSWIGVADAMAEQSKAPFLSAQSLTLPLDIFSGGQVTAIMNKLPVGAAEAEDLSPLEEGKQERPSSRTSP